jgi:hypothetical protein
VYVYGDATGGARKTSATAGSDYKLIADHPKLKRLGVKLKVPRANPPIVDRLAACNSMLCNAVGLRRMFISPSCTNLIADLQDRYYKPGSRDLGDKGDLGHVTDAMGYAVHRLFPIKLKTEGKMGVVAQKGSPLWVPR